MLAWNLRKRSWRWRLKSCRSSVVSPNLFKRSVILLADLWGRIISPPPAADSSFRPRKSDFRPDLYVQCCKRHFLVWADQERLARDDWLFVLGRGFHHLFMLGCAKLVPSTTIFLLAAAFWKRQVQSFFSSSSVLSPNQLNSRLIAIIKFYAVRKYLDFQCNVTLWSKSSFD